MPDDAWDRAYARGQERYRANYSVRLAVRDGVLPRAKTRACVDCGHPAHHYHHHQGYDPAYHLDVVPLCRSCHPRRHALERRAVARAG